MSLTVEEFTYDPFSQAAMSNPLPLYDVLREHHPVYFIEKYDTFFLSRFQDAWDFLGMTDNEFVTNEGSVFRQAAILQHNEGAVGDAPTAPMGSHLNYGSPVYEVVRQAHGKPMRPGSVRKLEPFIRGLVRGRLDELIPQGRFDLVHEFAAIVSVSTICHLFHLPLDQARSVLDTVNALTRTDHEQPGFDNAQHHRALVETVAPLVAARRASGPDGSWPLVDGMLDLRLDGRALNDTEIAVNLLCVLVGGTETVPKIVGHGLWELANHPDQLAAVRADLEVNCAVAAEEMNRFCGPAQWFGRTAREHVVIAGQMVKPGQRVVYLTQSANRDPREFDAPDEFRWNREIPRSLAFGRGQHFCLGVHLARLEERIMLEEFLGRVGDYRIDAGQAVRHPSSFQWGYSYLPVEVLV